MKTSYRERLAPWNAIGSWVVAITVGLMPGSVLADNAPYDSSMAPHESPHTAEPPTGGHSSLANAATNPIGNLIQLQLQNQYNWDSYNADVLN